MRAQALESQVFVETPPVPDWACALTPSVLEVRKIVLADGINATLRFSRGHGAGMVTAQVADVRRLSAAMLRSSVADVYRLVLGGLRDGGFPHPVRMWTFLPGIHDRFDDTLDRYRVFNSGRFDAFTEWFGGPSAFRGVLPAASAVGHSEEHLVVSALGTASPGRPIENPRQTSAYAYSSAHGPNPPCFARAMLAHLPIGARLLVSGTASINGEDSIHTGSLEGQLDETFENLRRLVQSVQGEHRFSLNNVETARVYFPRRTDRVALVARVESRLPSRVPVEYVPAMICRAELLVEIEATLASAPA